MNASNTGADRPDRKVLVEWLRDAYAMEEAGIPVLENHAKDARDAQPQIAARIDQHAQETRRQADALKMCLERLGESTSAMKTAMGKVTGLFQAVQTGASKDELVKNCLQDYAAEHFEIACYRSLVAGAQACGEQEVASVCQQILREEEQMAQWLEQNIPQVTQSHLQKANAAGTD